MSKELRRTGCEAPQHTENCSCLTCTNRECWKCPLLTKDHFTPKCIAFKVLGWTYKQVNQPLNIQLLSDSCHIAKDKSTQDKLIQLQHQVSGNTIKLGEHA